MSAVVRVGGVVSKEDLVKTKTETVKCSGCNKNWIGTFVVGERARVCPLCGKESE